MNDHRLEKEGMLLGSLLVVGTVIPEIAKIISVKNFISAKHQVIFKAISFLAPSGKITISNISLICHVFERPVSEKELLVLVVFSAKMGSIFDSARELASLPESDQTF